MRKSRLAPFFKTLPELLIKPLTLKETLQIINKWDRSLVGDDSTYIHNPLFAEIKAIFHYSELVVPRAYG